MYQEQGKNDLALAKYEQALAIQIKVLGHEHMDVATSLVNIALFTRIWVILQRP